MIKKGELCPHCNRYYDRHVVVDGIVEKDGKVLFIRRGIEPNIGKLALPGGYIDWDETLEEAVAREVLEETGVKAKVKHFLNIHSSPDRFPKEMQNIAVTYIMEVIDDSNLRPQKGEVLDVMWLDPENLPEEIAFDHQVFIREYLQYKNN